MANKKNNFALNLAQTVQKSRSAAGMGMGMSGIAPDPLENSYISSVVSTKNLEPSADSIVSISIDNLTESSVENEIYDSIQEEDITAGSAIDALARDIAKRGIQNPLRVIPADNFTYEIVSGHRRFHALRIAKERYQFKDFDKVPCIVDSKPASNRTFETTENLILDNLQRDKSEFERMKEIVMFKKCVEKRKLAGEEIPVVRDYVKNHLGVSDSQITRYDKIYQSLIEPLMQDFHKGKIAGSVAYKISTTEQAAQEYINTHWDREAAPTLQLNIVTDLFNQYIADSRSVADKKEEGPHNSDAVTSSSGTTSAQRAAPKTLIEGVGMMTSSYNKIEASLSRPFTADAKTKNRLLKKVTKMVDQFIALEKELAALGLLEDNDNREG